MKGLQMYVSIVDFTNKILLWLLGIMLFLIFVFLTAQVLFRYVINASLSWTDEASRFLTIWVVFLGTSLSVRNKSLIAVEAINQFVPKKIKKIFKIFVFGFSIVFCFFLIVYGIEMIKTIAGQRSIALDLPMWIPYLAVPVGAAHIIMNISVEMIESFEERMKE